MGKIYTSYYAMIRRIKAEDPNAIFVAVSGGTPDWYGQDDNHKEFLLREVAPHWKWWKEWHSKFKDNYESDESKEWYTAKYKETVLDALDIEKIKETLKSFMPNSENLYLLCFETANKFCHRHLLANWLNEKWLDAEDNSIEEYSKKNVKIDFKAVTHLNSRDEKHLVINDKYICEFILPDDLKPDETYVYFSESWREANCPRFTSYTDVKVYDTDTYECCNGKLYYNIDMDLNRCNSLALYLYEDADSKKPTRGITVCTCDIEDTIVPFKEFMKLIKFKSLSGEIEEPYDSCGLAICTFERINDSVPGIEYDIDGKLYYEIVDFDNYTDGEYIPLDSARRHDVIPFVKLSKDNMQKLADKINESLAKHYSKK